MSDHEFWDEDVERIKSHADIGNADVYEVIFNEPIEALNIHKDDVIYLAKLLGLVVYDKCSELGQPNNKQESE